MSLAAFLAGTQRPVILTGAGCSTESGIPDYRSPGGAWARHRPIYYSEFVRSEEIRRFYWARSYRGWPRFAAARPNDAHRAIAELEARGGLHFLITQNVDDLHEEAGSRHFVQLHGRNRVVVCLGCHSEFPRDAMQERIGAMNPDGVANAAGLVADEAEFAPDGDAAVVREAVRGFRIPACERCGGVLKPHVVFFGESVPQERVAVAMQRLDEADALLVAGSSLTVWSGFRFVKRAAERGLPIAIVNIGTTRGDALATLKIEARCGTVLSDAIRTLPPIRSHEASGSNSAADRR
ncbi:MAG TPA: NAD-dependent protein deacetylase [Ramlibacter sp.]|nr:NAD-dependent protein deacetylase [Ramlibacter sp.]